MSITISYDYLDPQVGQSISALNVPQQDQSFEFNAQPQQITADVGGALKTTDTVAEAIHTPSIGEGIIGMITEYFGCEPLTPDEVKDIRFAESKALGSSELSGIELPKELTNNPSLNYAGLVGKVLFFRLLKSGEFIKSAIDFGGFVGGLMKQNLNQRNVSIPHQPVAAVIKQEDFDLSVLEGY